MDSPPEGFTLEIQSPKGRIVLNQNTRLHEEVVSTLKTDRREGCQSERLHGLRSLSGEEGAEAA